MFVVALFAKLTENRCLNAEPEAEDMSHSTHNEHGNSTESGHEASTVQIGGITWFIVVLTVGVVFAGWLMSAVLNSFEGREKKAELESRPSPFAAERAKLPPEPRLQLAPGSEEQIDKNEPPNLKTQHPLEEFKHCAAPGTSNSRVTVGSMNLVGSSGSL